MAADPYRTPAPPETPEQESARLSSELEMLQAQNVARMSVAERHAGRKRIQFITARLSFISRSWDREAFWAALGDDDRLQLVARTCLGCGSIYPSCRCGDKS